MNGIKVAIFGTDRLFVEALFSLVTHFDGLEPIAAEGQLIAIDSLLRNGSVELLIVDADSTPKDVYEKLRKLKETHDINILTITSGQAEMYPALDDHIAVRSSGSHGLRLAVFNILRKRIPVISVRETPRRYRSPQGLTKREFEVATLIAQGMPNRDISEAVGIQEQSIKNLASVIMRKLDCKNRVQVALKLNQDKLGSPF